MVRGSDASVKIWFLESMRELLASAKRRPGVACGMRRLLSVPFMMKSVSRMLSSDMDSASMSEKAFELEFFVAALITRAELVQMLFLLMPPVAPPLPAAPESPAPLDDLGAKPLSRAHEKSKSAGPGCAAPESRLYSQPLHSVPICAASFSKSTCLASMPETMFVRKPSVMPRFMTSDALGMHAPAARLALITWPVAAMRCIGSLFLSRPSVNSLVSCACASQLTSSRCLSARLLISERHMRCTSISCANSMHCWRVLPSLPIIPLVCAAGIVGAPCSLRGGPSSLRRAAAAAAAVTWWHARAERRARGRRRAGWHLRRLRVRARRRRRRRRPTGPSNWSIIAPSATSSRSSWSSGERACASGARGGGDAAPAAAAGGGSLLRGGSLRGMSPSSVRRSNSLPTSAESVAVIWCTCAHVEGEWSRLCDQALTMVSWSTQRCRLRITSASCSMQKADRWPPSSGFMSAKSMPDSGTMNFSYTALSMAKSSSIMRSLSFLRLVGLVMLYSRSSMSYQLLHSMLA